MKMINIIESNEKQNTIRLHLAKPIISKKGAYPKNIKLNNLCIYLNLIAFYFFLITLYKSNSNKTNKIKNPFFKDNYKKYDSLFEQTIDAIINKYKRLSIIWPLTKEIKFRPFMSKNELIAFSYFMKPENIYFEFGSGGSTNLASYYKVKTFSVESDVRWHDKLKKNGIIANYITIDLNARYKGYPGKNTTINDWKKYIQAYKREFNADIILIDGRFRIACALDIFSKIRNDTIIFIHDYERKEYHILERFYLKIKMWDSLVLFIKNPNVKSIPKSLYNFYLKEKILFGH